MGAADVEEEGEPFEEKMKRLMPELEAQFTGSSQLETAIRENLRHINDGS